MLNFFPENKDPTFSYFNYIVKITPIKEEPFFQFESIFSKNVHEEKELNGQLGRFCFPYPSNPIQANGVTFTYAFTDMERNYSYCYVHVNKNKGTPVAYAIVSKYYHPQFLCEVVELISQAAEKDISDARKLCQKIRNFDLIRRSYDYMLNQGSDNIIQNSSLLSPENEIEKLLTFLFTRFPVNDILSLIVALLLDCRIIVISSEMNLLGQTIFAILGLIYPLQWQGTFIPMLPTSIATALEAPFAYIIGVHSSMAAELYNEGIEQYFVLNVDAHYASLIGMDDYPAEIIEVIQQYSERIRNKCMQYRPLFPKHKVQSNLRKFILKILSVAFDNCSTKTPSELNSAFMKYRDSVSDEFSVIIAQTQFVDTFMRSISDDVVVDVIHAFWPKYEYKPVRMSGRRRTERKPLTVRARIGYSSKCEAKNRTIELPAKKPSATAITVHRPELSSLSMEAAVLEEIEGGQEAQDSPTEKAEVAEQ